jgi:PadR family transcriptional regulator, regulatory protein PadR
LLTSLTENQYLILAAVAGLAGRGYGVSIRETINEAVGKDLSYGRIYTTLEQLEQDGLVKGEWGEPTAERGGRRKRHYRITGVGEQVLSAEERRRLALQQAASRMGGAYA